MVDCIYMGVTENFCISLQSFATRKIEEIKEHLTTLADNEFMEEYRNALVVFKMTFYHKMQLSFMSADNCFSTDSFPTVPIPMHIIEQTRKCIKRYALLICSFRFFYLLFQPHLRVSGHKICRSH